MFSPHTHSNSGKTPPEQRARNRALLRTWKNNQRVGNAQSRFEQAAKQRKAAVESVLHSFTPEKIPMGTSIVKGRFLDKNGLFGMIVTLNIDSYYLECLQTIKQFADALKNPILFSEELTQKLTKIGKELEVGIDATSFESEEYFIDDFLDALILMRSAYSPNEESDLYQEFDIYLSRYFGEMSSVRLNTTMKAYRDSVMNFVPVDQDKIKGMLSYGGDVNALKAQEDLGMAGIDFACMQVQSVLSEIITRSTQ